MGDDHKITPHDAAALAACFEAHAGRVFGFACMLTREDRALADDLVQATFEAAARAWDTLRGLADDQRRNWLRSTLVHIAASREMPRGQHVVAVLRWQLGMKEAEIAAVLSIAESTVSAQLHRARRKLIEGLEPDHPFARDDPEGASS